MAYNTCTLLYSPALGPVNGKLKSVNKLLSDNTPCLPVRSPTGQASWLSGEQISEAP